MKSIADAGEFIPITGPGPKSFKPGVRVYCGDARIKYTHAQQVLRGRRAESGEVLPKHIGCFGRSIFVKELDYVDSNNIWVAPIAHAGLYGVVKNFLSLVLGRFPNRDDDGEEDDTWYLISRQARDVIKQRGKLIVDTVDQGRAYSCVVDKRGSWTMAEYCAFVETWSSYIFADYYDNRSRVPCHVLPTKELRDMWMLLSQGLVHYLRPMPGVSETSDGRKAAHDCLMKYARLVQEHLGAEYCTYNLHLICCRALDQEEARGNACYSNEFWVERLIQVAKSTTKYRVTAQPEAILARQVALRAAVQTLKLRHPHLLTYDELVEPGRINRITLADDSNQAQYMVGSGREADVLALAKIKHSYERLARDFPGIRNLTDDDKVFVYQRAMLTGGELVFSKDYTRSRTKISYWAKVTYDEVDAQGNDVTVTYMALIHKFVLIKWHQRQTATRFALADLYTVRTLNGAGGSQYHQLFQCGDRDRKEVDYLVALKSIEQKMVLADGDVKVRYLKREGTRYKLERVEGRLFMHYSNTCSGVQLK